MVLFVFFWSELTARNWIRTINSLFCEFPAVPATQAAFGVHLSHAWVNIFTVRTVGILQLGLTSQQNVLNGHNEKPEVHAVDPRMLASM